MAASNQDARPFVDLRNDAQEFREKFDEDIKRICSFLDEKLMLLICDPDSLHSPTKKSAVKSSAAVEFSKAKYDIFSSTKNLMNEMEREWLKYISEMKKLFIENVEILLAGTKLEVKLPSNDLQTASRSQKSPLKDRTSIGSTLYPIINNFAKNMAALSSPLLGKDANKEANRSKVAARAPQQHMESVQEKAGRAYVKLFRDIDAVVEAKCNQNVAKATAASTSQWEYADDDYDDQDVSSSSSEDHCEILDTANSTTQRSAQMDSRNSSRLSNSPGPGRNTSRNPSTGKFARNTSFNTSDLDNSRRSSSGRFGTRNRSLSSSDLDNSRRSSVDRLGARNTSLNRSVNEKASSKSPVRPSRNSSAGATSESENEKVSKVTPKSSTRLSRKSSAREPEPEKKRDESQSPKRQEIVAKKNQKRGAKQVQKSDNTAASPPKRRNLEKPTSESDSSNEPAEAPKTKGKPKKAEKSVTSATLELASSFLHLKVQNCLNCSNSL